MIRRACLVIFVVLLFALICPVYAGPVFDDILNAMQIDQSLQRKKRDNWGNITNDYKSITQDAPLGQTFITGDSVGRLCRIALNVSYSNEEWQPGETLVLTLWDSPDKKIKLGSFGIPYERRFWNRGIIMFTLEKKVEPRKHYYFELTVEGGNGKIAGILAAALDPDYTGGTAYEGNQPQKYDLWFETYVKKTADKNANLAAFYSNFNLDYPGLEKVKTAVNIKDWETAEKEFLVYFESRKDLFPDDAATPVLDPKYDTKEADLALQHKWLDDGTIADFGLDWNFSYTNTSYAVSSIMKYLADAYVKTTDEKYARACNEMLKSIYREYPSPLKSGLVKNDEKVRAYYESGISGSPSIWGAMSICRRIYPNKYNEFRKSPSFEPDARMAWWLSVIESANLLERRDSSGSSWERHFFETLLQIGRLYPEIRKCKE